MLSEPTIACPLDDCSYVPYEEVRLNWRGSGTEFSIETPWIELSVELDPGAVERLKSLCVNLHLPESRYSVSNIFKSLRAYPLAYVEPRKGLSRARATHSEPVLKGWQDAASTPEALTRSILGWLRAGPIPPVQGQSRGWGWDVKEILSKSALGGGIYDPLAAYSAITRLRLIAEMKSARRQQLFELLGRLLRDDKERFFESVILVVRQIYYVTRKCEEAISPACAAFPQAGRQIAAFLADERGHDALIGQTLKALGEETPDEAEASTGVKILMSILRFAAARHNFALCNIIPCFEGLSFAEGDPLAALLRKSSRGSAAAGLENHYKLNKGGGHVDIGRVLSLSLTPVDEQTIAVATLLTELTVLHQESMAAELIERITTC